MKARGVVDIKFHFDRTKIRSLSKTVTEVCELLEAVLEGRYTKARPLGDSQGRRELN